MNEQGNREEAVAVALRSSSIPATPLEPAPSSEPQSSTTPEKDDVPRSLLTGQTVCTAKNAKGKSCHGFLKQIGTGGEKSEDHLRGLTVFHKCQTCGALYAGPPLGHLRDSGKQQRYVQKELTAILKAAGGTLPVFDGSKRLPAPATRKSGMTFGADSSARADEHRPAAEAQAATGKPSAAPMSSAAATAAVEASSGDDVVKP